MAGIEETYPAFADKIVGLKQMGFKDEEIQGVVQSRMHDLFRMGFKPEEVNTALGEIKKPSIMEPIKGTGKALLEDIKAAPGAMLDMAKSIGKAAITQPKEGMFDLSKAPERLADVAKGVASGLTAGIYQPEATDEAQAARQTLGTLGGFAVPFGAAAKGAQALGAGKLVSEVLAGAATSAAGPLSRGDVGEATKGAIAGGVLGGAANLASVVFQRFFGRAPKDVQEVQTAARTEPEFAKALDEAKAQPEAASVPAEEISMTKQAEPVTEPPPAPADPLAARIAALEAENAGLRERAGIKPQEESPSVPVEKPAMPEVPKQEFLPDGTPIPERYQGTEKAQAQSEEMGTWKRKRGPQGEIGDAVERHLNVITDTPAMLDFKGKEYEGAVVEGKKLRLKNDPDKIISNPKDMLLVEEKIPFDIPEEKPVTGVRPAIRMKDGETVIGDVGQRHDSVMAKIPESQHGAIQDTGWVSPEGKWMTPDQATEYNFSKAVETAQGREDLRTAATQAELQRGSVTLPGRQQPLPNTAGARPFLQRDTSARDLMRSTIREYAGDRYRRQAQFEEAMKPYVNEWDKADIQSSLKFIDDVEGGKQQANPKDQALADQLRGALDQRRTRVQALGTGKLEDWIENYFPHIWEQPGEAERVIGRMMGRRPLEGQGSFLKQRTIPTTVEGINAGLSPVTYNPVKLALLKINEMDRYIMAHNIKNQLVKEDAVKFVPFGQKAPEGWQPLNDKMFRVLQHSDAEKGFIVRGGYYAPADAAKSFNNYLSPGLSGNVAFDAVRKVGNTLNQAQLGFSAFHLGFTSVDAMTSDVSLAIEQAMRGHPFEAGKSALRAASLYSPIENALAGNRLLKEYLEPGSYAKYSREADALAKAGGRPFMDQFYKNQAIDSFWKAWKEGDYAKVGLKALPATMEYLSKPIMEYIVPRQKLGVFSKMATDILGRADEQSWSQPETKLALQKAWDSVDNRMGQIVYDNLFWNRAVKDLGMISTRSLGWNIGTVRELGGGAKDMLTKPFEMTHRKAYVMALPITVGYLGALYNYLSTGEAPQEPRDYFFPRTGELDQHGNPERVSFPSYMKDIYAVSKHPLTTVGHKVNPLVSSVVDMLNNQDFFGTEIRNGNDPLVKQVADVGKYVGEQFMPFSLRNASQRAKAVGEEHPYTAAMAGKTAQSFVGLTPAPASVTKTTAEEIAGDFMTRRAPAGMRTAAEASQRDKTRTLEHQYAIGKIQASDINQAFQAGEITKQQATDIVSYSKLPPLVRMVRHLRLDESLSVYEAATPAEQKQIRYLVANKVKTLSSYLPDERAKLVERFKQDMQK